MTWKFTNILHGPRLSLGVTPNEYCVLDIYYQSQTSPKYSVDGWSENSYKQIGAFLGFSKGAVFKMVTRFVDLGLMEVNPANSKQKRTTEEWYTMAYEDVSKVNAPQLGVSKVNAKVSKVNAIRSISERHIEECKEEDKKNIKEEHVELSLDVSFPNQGSQSPDVSPEGSAAPAAPATKPKSLDEKAQCVLDYWNSTIRAGRRPLTGKTHRQEIRARINGGATWLDCVSVIADRALCWLHNQEMKDSLNPTTCFRASNFPRYLDHWLDLPAHKQAKVKDLQSFCLALPPATTDARSYTTPSTSPIRKTYTGTRRQRANASAAQ